MPVSMALVSDNEFVIYGLVGLDQIAIGELFQDQQSVRKPHFREATAVLAGGDHFGGEFLNIFAVKEITILLE